MSFPMSIPALIIGYAVTTHMPMRFLQSHKPLLWLFRSWSHPYLHLRHLTLHSDLVDDLLKGECCNGLEDEVRPSEDLRALEEPQGHVGGEGNAQGEGGDGLEDRVGPGENLRALEEPQGHVGDEGRAQGDGGHGL